MRGLLRKELKLPVWVTGCSAASSQRLRHHRLLQHRDPKAESERLTGSCFAQWPLCAVIRLMKSDSNTGHYGEEVLIFWVTGLQDKSIAANHTFFSRINTNMQADWGSFTTEYTQLAWNTLGNNLYVNFSHCTNIICLVEQITIN